MRSVIIIRIPNEDKSLFQGELDALETAVSSANYFETTTHIDFARLSYRLGKYLRPSSNNIWINQMGAGTSFYGLVNKMFQFRIHSAADANDKSIIERSMLNNNVCKPLTVDHLICALSNRDNIKSPLNYQLTELDYNPKLGSQTYSELLTWIVERKWNNQSPGHSQFTRWYLEKHPFYNITFEKTIENIVGIQYSNDEYGMYLFCLTTTHIIVYCLTSHIILKNIQHNIEDPRSFSISYRNEDIAVANHDCIYLIQFDRKQEIKSQIFVKQENVTGIAFSTDLESNGIAYSANQRFFKKNIDKVVIQYDKKALPGLSKDILVMKYPHTMYEISQNQIVMIRYTEMDFCSFYLVPDKYKIVHYDFSYSIEKKRACTILVLVLNKENQQYEILVYDNNRYDKDNTHKELVETIEIEDFEPTKIAISPNFKSCCIYSTDSFRTYTIPYNEQRYAST